MRSCRACAWQKPNKQYPFTCVCGFKDGRWLGLVILLLLLSCMWLSVRAQMRRADSCTTLSLIYIIWQIHQTRARWFICDFQSYDCFLRFCLRKCGCQHSERIRWHLDGSVKNPLCDKRTLWYTPLSLFFIWCVYFLVNVFTMLRVKTPVLRCFLPEFTFSYQDVGRGTDRRCSRCFLCPSFAV